MSTTPSTHPVSCACREHPLHESLPVREALDRYLEENGFTRAAYDDPWTKASLFGIPISIPNTARHCWAIMLHDLHHVATGFGTDLVGEGEISAWEARGRLRPLGLYVAMIVLTLAAGGFLLAPTRAWRASRVSGRTATLFDEQTRYEELMTLTVGELRERLGVPPGGLVSSPRRLHPQAPRGVPAAA